MKVSNIDVTLRDGGYRNLFSFSDDYAMEHVLAMDKVGVEWIEIGYRNGSFKPIDNIGRTGISPDDYIRAVRSFVKRECICVMVHPRNVTLEDLAHMRRLGVDMLRFCADQADLPKTFEYVRVAKKLGFTVCFNLTRISRLDTRSMTHDAVVAAEAGADVVYLADSNGSMTPDRVEQLVSTIRNICDCQIGFHAHDNIGLAMSNSIAALNAGATFMDSSLRGMGKGAGNLKLELWSGFLRREFNVTQYDCAALLDQVDKLEKTDLHARPSQPLDDLILGMLDLSVDHREKLHKNAKSVSDMLFNAEA